jgi:phosphomevalonate kinase
MGRARCHDFPCLHACVQIGSGFDVCAAVFGSVTYLRVTSDVLGQHMASVEAALESVKSSTAIVPSAAVTEAREILAGTAKLESWDFHVVRSTSCPASTTPPAFSC